MCNPCDYYQDYVIGLRLRTPTRNRAKNKKMYLVIVFDYKTITNLLNFNRIYFYN